MKRSKILAAVVAAAMAVMVLLGASTASATVLCETETFPCSAVYPKGTELKADLTSPSIFEKPNGAEFSRCGKETLVASVANAGGPSTRVMATLNALEFSECTGYSKTVLKTGSLEIEQIPFTNDGTVRATEMEFTFELFGLVHCKWRATSLNLGVLHGGSDPTLNVTLPLEPLSICNGSEYSHWTTTFTLTTPSPLYVKER